MEKEFFRTLLECLKLSNEGVPQILKVEYRQGDLPLVYDELLKLHIEMNKWRLIEGLKVLKNGKWDKIEGYEDPFILFNFILNQNKLAIFIIEGFEYLENIGSIEMILEDIINSNKKIFLIFLVFQGRALPLLKKMKTITYKGPTRKVLFDLIEECSINFNNYQKACLATAMEGLTFFSSKKLIKKIELDNLNFEKAINEAVKAHFENILPIGLEILYPENIKITKQYFMDEAISYLENFKNEVLLFLGPPGSGKTSLPFFWAKKKEKFLYLASPQILRNQFVGGTEKNLYLFFEMIQELPAGILLFDEYEKIISAQAFGPESDGGLGLRVIALFLDFFNRPSHHIRILTANNLNLISEAEIRRFNTIFFGYIPEEIFLEISEDLDEPLKTHLKNNAKRLRNILNWQDIEFYKKREKSIDDIEKMALGRFKRLSSLFEFKEERRLKNIWETIVSQKGGKNELLAYNQINRKRENEAKKCIT